MQAIYCRRNNLGSLALRTALWSSWSHCGIVTPELTVIEASAFHGVVERPWADFIADVSRYALKPLWVPDEAAAIAFARAQVGKRYDWPGVIGIALRRDWQERDSWFCSELIEAAAVAGGRQRFVNNAWRVTPQHSWMVL
ncbi:YiiX/YebB-like N1pC/P60 family cysteine hydrolase [Aquabacterium sp.]|uniref:YiiX/YebB-like N1pC/P60 family cysteine hydrolase n=1 Tax=Aquabacterium sp. TaxID=1872578 RepID=UPI0025C38980|nr:YiiX/YebB-like N1pC/P60 family cysteine hydrolase [Aquabacterium sp.]